MSGPSHSSVAVAVSAATRHLADVCINTTQFLEEVEAGVGVVEGADGDRNGKEVRPRSLCCPRAIALALTFIPAQIIEEGPVEPVERILFHDKEGEPLSFWIEGKIAASVRAELERLIKVSAQFVRIRFNLDYADVPTLASLASRRMGV